MSIETNVDHKQIPRNILDYTHYIICLVYADLFSTFCSDNKSKYFPATLAQFIYIYFLNTLILVHVVYFIQ